MTVLVTGAAGFLGSHVTDLLLELGERPRVLICPGDSSGPLEAAGTSGTAPRSGRRCGGWTASCTVRPGPAPGAR